MNRAIPFLLVALVFAPISPCQTPLAGQRKPLEKGVLITEDNLQLEFLGTKYLPFPKPDGRLHLNFKIENTSETIIESPVKIQIMRVIVEDEFGNKYKAGRSSGIPPSLFGRLKPGQSYQVSCSLERPIPRATRADVSLIVHAIPGGKSQNRKQIVFNCSIPCSAWQLDDADK